MKDEAKAAGTIALISAAAGAGLALGFGLRLFSVLAVAGLASGVALGLMAGGESDTSEAEPEAPAAAI